MGGFLKIWRYAMAEDEGFKIKDRRRFDESGNRKEFDGDAGDANEHLASAEPSRGATTTDRVKRESGAPAQEQFVMKDSPEDSGAQLPIDYSSFVLSLATQAMVQLGEMDPPPGVEIPKNRQAAKHSIDVLEMLSVKTRGNLSEAEQRLTEEILHSLRIGFVRSKDS
jgi:hypothetical protein